MIKPLPGYVLIEPMDEDEKTASGFVLPEKSKEKPAKGKVIKTSEGPWETYYEGGLLVKGQKACPVFEKDIVVFHRWSGQDVKDGQKEYKLVKFGDLMGVYED